MFVLAHTLTGSNLGHWLLYSDRDTCGRNPDPTLFVARFVALLLLLYSSGIDNSARDVYIRGKLEIGSKKEEPSWPNELADLY
jgi:hypothetical protein